MAEYIEREALLHDIEQSVVYTVREKITSAEMRGAHKIIERIKCAPAVEPIYIHEPKKSEFKRMAVQMDYVPVVRCKDCKYYKPDEYEFGCGCDGGLLYVKADDDFCSYGARKDEENG
jgi:hypothetical protein